ncbi:isochorismatase family protein [Phenylobacterium montanum]|uniref:Isochorismatase family protein n=1 Tax=Phenylobacterium montanum TaxID=2823693 RepID=A0A975G2Y8_9CAUL|nr:isochorismatase family protein [Caulobacter sp. S6]QUD89574.1 isochorismatase family protein [Caulobacter sp. S6]
MPLFDRRKVFAFAPLVAVSTAIAASTTSSRAMTANTNGFSTRNSLIMLVDHQTGTVNWVKSIPKETVVTSCRVLAKMALAYDMPLILTTTVEQQVGPTIPDLQQIAPEAYAHRYARGGQLDCWDDARLQQGVAALGRKKIILAGLTTDICMYWAATSALKLGYEVLVVADACGTTSTQGDEMTYARLRKAGAEVSVVNQVVTELANDFSTAEGQKAQKIMADEIISKL